MPKKVLVPASSREISAAKSKLFDKRPNREHVSRDELEDALGLLGAGGDPALLLDRSHLWLHERGGSVESSAAAVVRSIDRFARRIRQLITEDLGGRPASTGQGMYAVARQPHLPSKPLTRHPLDNYSVLPEIIYSNKYYGVFPDYLRITQVVHSQEVSHVHQPVVTGKCTRFILDWID